VDGNSPEVCTRIISVVRIKQRSASPAVANGINAKSRSVPSGEAAKPAAIFRTRSNSGGERFVEIMQPFGRNSPFIPRRWGGLLPFPQRRGQGVHFFEYVYFRCAERMDALSGTSRKSPQKFREAVTRPAVKVNAVGHACSRASCSRPPGSSTAPPFRSILGASATARAQIGLQMFHAVSRRGGQTYAACRGHKSLPPDFSLRENVSARRWDSNAR
jgi:hypothetical protein